MKEKPRMDESLVIAEYLVNAGMCGEVASLSNFQRTTKMSGGDEFVVMFGASEASRLGVRYPEGYVEACNAFVALYDDASEEDKKTLVVFKGLGHCKAIDAMGAFSTRSQRKDWDELLDRYMATENARLGRSEAKRVKTCSNLEGLVQNLKKMVE